MIKISGQRSNFFQPRNPRPGVLVRRQLSPLADLLVDHPLRFALLMGFQAETGRGGLANAFVVEESGLHL